MTHAHFEKTPTVETLEYIPPNLSLDELIQLALHQSCPQQLVIEFASHEHLDVRCAVATRTDLSEEAIWQLSADSSPRVRYKLAGNHSLHQFALEVLIEDEHQSVSEKAERTLSAKTDTNGIGSVFHRIFTFDLKKAS